MPAILIGGLVMLLVVAGVYWWSNRPAVDAVSLEYYQTALEAVTATEEQDFRRATALWVDLLRAEPDNAIYKLNQAITVLKWIEEVEGELNSGQLEPERLAVLQQELADAYARIETVVGALTSMESLDGGSVMTDYRTAFVRSALLEKKAAREPEQRLELLQQAAGILEKQLSAPESLSPTGHLLSAIKYDELAAELEADVPSLQRQNGDFLLAAFRRQPRNLFVLKRAAEVLIANQDARLKELLPATVDLAEPMMTSPDVARIAARLDPENLIVKVASAVDADAWPQVREIQGWLNTLLSTSGFRSDSRLAKPDILALLETDFLLPLARRIALPEIPPSSALPIYTVHSATPPAQACAWYDFDADLVYDVVLASGEELLFLPWDGGELVSQPAHRVALGMTAGGILPVDLFQVDLPGRPLLPKSVQELMEKQQDTAPEANAEFDSKRHDTLQELVVWGEAGIRIVTQDSEGNFQLLEASTGLEGIVGVRGIAPLDIESDGDLDLVVMTATGVRIMQNLGNRMFEEISPFSILPAAIAAAVVGDVDRDTDQDIVWVAAGSPQVAWLENVLHGQFRSSELAGDAWRGVKIPTDVALADIDGNGSWDVIACGPTQTSIAFTSLLDDQTWHATGRVEAALGGSCLAVADLNNDGALEIVCGGDDGLRVLAGRYDRRGRRIVDVQPQELALAGSRVTSLNAMDADGDGAVELLAIADGNVVICRTTALQGNYTLVRVAGINDVSGGGRVNHYAMGSTLEIWADGEEFSRIVDKPVTHFGLGGRQPDNLRIVFPNGLTQNQEELAANVLVEEEQVLRGSCPYAYGWNGQHFELITDLLWNAPLGLQIARGTTLPDRRWENLLLPGDRVLPRDGRIELRLTEELWEVAYFDHVALTAIDHPADVRVFTNEKVGPPQLAQHRVYAVRDKLLPHSAHDSHGRDVTAALQMEDGKVVQAFDRLICQGRAEPHFIELDFGTLPVAEHELVLFLTGWMYPTDTSLNIAIDQNPDRSLPEPPSLWVVDEQGTWVCAQPFMGFPGGKTKSIAIDLTDAFRSNDHRLRIASSQQLYWDEAFVGWHAGDELIRQQPLAIAAAELRYRGFSALLPRRPDQPHWFDYNQVTQSAKWPALTGPFTRFGDVAALLANDDDRLVVMVSGDEIALEFTLPEQALPDGWTRDFVLHSTGWDKDADLNTLQGQGSLPLPFKDQTEYPAPVDQFEQAAAVWAKNAATLTRFKPFRP